MTGGGRGWCNPAGPLSAGYGAPVYGGFGRGMGMGRGRGWWGAGGGGRGWRHWYYATGQPGWARFGAAPAWGTPATGAPPTWDYGPYAAPPTREQEAAALRSQAEWVSQQLQAIEQRLEELGRQEP